MNFNKLYRVLPFAILLLVTLITWTKILTVTHAANLRQYAGAGLVLINIIVYIFSLRIGVLLTGVTLALATLNLVAFTSTIVTTQYWLGFSNLRIALPVFQPLALLLLLFFLGFNLKYLSKSFRRHPTTIAE
jgi:hypothetical protein